MSTTPLYTVSQESLAENINLLKTRISRLDDPKLTKTERLTVATALEFLVRLRNRVVRPELWSKTPVLDIEKIWDTVYVYLYVYDDLTLSDLMVMPKFDLI